MTYKKKKKKNTPHLETIRQIYKQPSQWGSLGGLRRFAREQGLSLRQAREALERDYAYTLHKPVRRSFPTSRVVVMGIDHQWVADLVDMQKLSRYNRGIKYLLTVVDAFSKYAWVEPIKDKSASQMKAAWQRILKRASPRRPQRLQTDKGTEFYNAPLRQYWAKMGIRHFSTSGDAKAGLVERFNRTLKSRMYRYFTAANTLKYLDHLPALVRGYNHSFHRSIQKAPADVNQKNEKEVWHTLYGPTESKKKKKPTFDVGDRVRISQARRPFKKGYLPQWTEEVFEVSRVVDDSLGPITYKLKELDGTSVQGSFYRQELQKVQVDDDTVWRIDKVLKRRGDRLYVQWKGWPKKYNSWIHRDDVVPP